jgi:CHAT domain-containing protein
MMDGKDDHNFDGIFTCKEASVLDLNKTLLVNLSACNTGLGSTMTIEGIGGFRRAFSLSGAKNLMITLKPISDEFTAKYMNLFYTKLSNNNWNVLKAYQETNNFFINYFRTEGEVLDIYEYIAPFVLSSWEK